MTTATVPIQHRRGRDRAIKRSFSLPSRIMAYADSQAAITFDGNLSRYLCSLIKRDMALNPVK